MGDGKPGPVTSFDRSNIINTKYNEGASSFSPDTSEIYFTRCGSDKQFEVHYHTDSQQLWHNCCDYPVRISC